MNWSLIDNNTPESEPILVWAPKAHRGRDSCEVIVLCRSENGEVSFWTNGGPNAGSDLYFEIDEVPTHWMRLPEGPK